MEFGKKGENSTQTKNNWQSHEFTYTKLLMFLKFTCNFFQNANLIELKIKNGKFKFDLKLQLLLINIMDDWWKKNLGFDF